MQPVRPPGHHSTHKQQTNEFRLECTPIAHRELPLPPPPPFEMHKVKMKWAALFRWDFASGNRSVKDIKNSSLLLPPLCVTSTGSERAKLDATRDRGGGFVIWPKSFPLLVDGWLGYTSSSYSFCWHKRAGPLLLDRWRSKQESHKTGHADSSDSSSLSLRSIQSPSSFICCMYATIERILIPH